MTLLTVYPDNDPSQVLIDTREADVITRTLASIGVQFERWNASRDLPAEADQQAVLDAYGEDIARLMHDGTYHSVDVVRVKPDIPDRAALRAKFLAEHTHSDDEVRFFVEGAGAFYLRKGGRVYRVICERNDLISVPADTTHWFDAGEYPQFCAIRIFASPDGWVGHFTGDDIATRFPAFEMRA